MPGSGATDGGNSEGAVSVAACRRLLAGAAEQLSDEQIERLREQLRAIAVVMISEYSRSYVAEHRAWRAIPSNEQVDVAERAAILEFDGKLSRDDAERLALADYVRRLQ